jgi:hypothetical protein
MSPHDDALSTGEVWAMLRWIGESLDELHHGGERNV